MATSTTACIVHLRYLVLRDDMMRTTLYEPAQVTLMRSAKMVLAQGLRDEDRQSTAG
jgi:hypothetical protein